MLQCSKEGSHLAGRRPAPALRIHLHHVVESSRKDDLRLLLHVRGGVVNHKISALDHIHHIAIGNRLHPGYRASWRQRRVGGVVGDIHHREAAGGGIAARYGANVELVIGGERHRGVQTIGDRDRGGGIKRHVADVYRIEGWAQFVRCPGYIQGAVVHQTHTGSADWHRRRDRLRRDIKLCHRGWNGSSVSAFPAAIQHIGGVAVAAEEGIHWPGETGDLHRGNRGGLQVNQENRVRIIGEDQQILPARTERGVAGRGNGVSGGDVCIDNIDHLYTTGASAGNRNISHRGVSRVAVRGKQCHIRSAAEEHAGADRFRGIGDENQLDGILVIHHGFGSVGAQHLPGHGTAGSDGHWYTRYDLTGGARRLGGEGSRIVLGVHNQIERA